MKDNYDPFHVTSGPLTVACPYCGRKAQEVCTTRTTSPKALWGKPHQSRVSKYLKEATQ